MQLLQPLVNRPPLWLIRSDQGDGGWSLHTKEQMKAACDAGEPPEVLHSGPAEYIDADSDEWNRPTISDFVDAYKKLDVE